MGFDIPPWVHTVWAILVKRDPLPPNGDPTEERVYQSWWLDRNLPAARALGIVMIALQIMFGPVSIIVFIVGRQEVRAT